MTSQIIISDIGIRQDSCGRYSLNDLHKSAGGLPKHAPAQWLRIDQATDLINAIINMQICTFKPVDSYKGRYGGTYVCKELVYAYATWISPEFFLKVIRAYDALVTGNAQKADVVVKTTVDERTPLRDAVNLLVSKRHIMYPEAYAMIHQRFNVESIEDLSAELIPQAIEYAHRMALEGELMSEDGGLQEVCDLSRRYIARVTIKDNVFGGEIEFYGKSNTINALVTGICKTLGLSPSGFTTIAMDSAVIKRIH